MFQQVDEDGRIFRQPFLLMLTFAGSLLCWLPGFVRPSLDLPLLLPLLPVGLLSGLSATLADRRWQCVLASSAGTFAGLTVGCSIRPDPDGATQSYYGVIVVGVTLLTISISVISGLAGLVVSRSIGKRRNAIWIALVCSAMYGPIALLLTPPLAARRITRNETLASERFSGLKSAVERTYAGAGTLDCAFDGQALKRNYSGPPFSENDWRRIAGNAVKQDGYVFGILCYQDGYVIDASPERERKTACADSVPMSRGESAAGWNTKAPGTCVDLALNDFGYGEILNGSTVRACIAQGLKPSDFRVRFRHD